MKIETTWKDLRKDKTALPVLLNEVEIEEFGREVDLIRNEVMDTRGERDAKYIRRLIKVQRYLALFGRIVIFIGIGFLPEWTHPFASWLYYLPITALGILMLASAKILENMEIGHNVSHAQWDWMRDPNIQSGSWEWDHVCPSDQWKHSHNVRHHTWTNVFGKDADVGGYGLLRIFPEQKWKPFNIGNPIYALLLAVFFEWGIAVQELELGLIFSGKRKFSKIKTMVNRTGVKMFRQVAKDYILFPLLAGPFFFYVLIANAIACILRNLWTYLIIFCGHFPIGVHTFSRKQVENETRAHWYVRQILGSCNIGGGKLFHIMSGNLSHQIEHHMFPDMPSNRYPEVAPRVKALCARYNVPYNTGSLTRQFGTTVLRILRMTFPGHSPSMVSS